MDRSYSIGRVLGGSFEVVKRGFLPLIAIVLIFAAVPTILSYTVILPELGGLGADPAAQAAAFPNANWALIGPFYLVTLLLTGASYSAQFHASIRLLDGERVNVLESVRRGLRRALPMVASGILSYLAFIVGLVLFIVPGLILAVRWSAVWQALAVEDIGVFEAFSRSADLTRGSRWHSFLMFIVSLVMLAAYGAAIFAISAFLGAAGVPGIVLQSLLGFAFTLVIAALYAAHYVELRTIREGAGTNRLAEVFA